MSEETSNNTTVSEKKDQKKSFQWLAKYPDAVAWDSDIPVGAMHDLFDQSAEKNADNTFIEFLGNKYTYREAQEMVHKVAKGLQNLGVKKGIKVGIMMPNAPQYIFFYFGILKAGGTVVNYSPLYAPCEILQQIEDSDTDIMVTLDLEALYPKIFDLIAKTRLKKVVVCPLKDCLSFPKNILFPILRAKDVAKIHWDEHHISFKGLIDNAGDPAPFDVDPENDIAVLQYTGGTTGLPKGAMLTHKNIHCNAHQAKLWFNAVGGDGNKILAALPLFHVFAMTAVMNLAVVKGSEIVMMFPRFDPEEAMKLVQKHSITFLPAVPTIYNMMSNHPNVSKYNLSSISACLSGGAPLPLEVKKEFEDITGCTVIEAYGLSETSPAATSNPIGGESKVCSIGIPFPQTVVTIMSLDEPGKEMPIGEKGEICIAGPQVMKGYWKRTEETADALKDGMLHTGDVGYMDEDGYTFLVDRIKDMILCSGFNVYPRNVEEAIYKHPSVEETTVIGVPDEKRGETVKAFVKLKANSTLTADELIEFLNDKLSPIEMPKLVEFRDELPKTLIGKLSKKELVAEEESKAKAKES